MYCESCEVLVINGAICHETGCPNSYKDEIRECKWCGVDFRPESKYDYLCSEDCREIYNS